MAGHRYWRVFVTANNGGSLVGLSELEMYENYFGPNVCTGGSAISSSSFNANYAASYAFDGVPWNQTEGGDANAGIWTSSGSSNEYVGYDFGIGVTKSITSVGIWGVGTSVFNRSPKNFHIDWSDDNSSWTTSWTVSNITNWTAYQATSQVVFQRFPSGSAPAYFGSPWGAHTYWRYAIPYTGGNIVSCAEMAMNATPGGSTTTSGGTPFASSNAGLPTFGPAKAFDGNLATFWASGNNNHEWLGYQFASAQALAEIDYTAESGQPNRAASNFQIQFSNDGSLYTTCSGWSGDGFTSWTSNQQRVFTDPNYVAPPTTAKGFILY
jgi:hypothetical protein